MKQMIKESNQLISTERTQSLQRNSAHINSTRSIDSGALTSKFKEPTIPSVKVKIQQNKQQTTSLGVIQQTPKKTLSSALQQQQQQPQQQKVSIQTLDSNQQMSKKLSGSENKLIEQQLLSTQKQISMKTPSFPTSSQKNQINNQLINNQLSEVKSFDPYHQQQLQRGKNDQIESVNLSSIMMPMNQSQLNLNDESIHTFIRENQSLLQVLPSAYSTKEKPNDQQNNYYQQPLNKQVHQDIKISQNSSSDVNQINNFKSSTQIQVYGKTIKAEAQQRSRQTGLQDKNPYFDSINSHKSRNMSLGSQNDAKTKQRSLSQVSIVLKENNSKRQLIPLQLNSYLNNNLEMQKYNVQEQQSNSQINMDQNIIQLLMKMNQDLREEFRQFQKQTTEKIYDLEMKHLNQQETIDYLLNLLQNQGVNVFNKFDLKDDSIKDSNQQRKQKIPIRPIFQGDQVNQQSDQTSGEYQEKNKTENLYYYSQEELYRHNETSNYEEARMRNISEPDIVHRIPFEQSTLDNQNTDDQQQIEFKIELVSNQNLEESQKLDSQQYTLKSNLMYSDQDEVEIQAPNFEYQYMTNHQFEENSQQSPKSSFNQSSINNQEIREAFNQKIETASSQQFQQQQQQQQSLQSQHHRDQSTLSNKMIVIDLQNSSYLSHKQGQYHSYLRDQQLNYLSNNSNINNFQQYLNSHQSKFIEQDHNLIQTLENKEKIIIQEDDLMDHKRSKSALNHTKDNLEQNQAIDQESNNNLRKSSSKIQTSLNPVYAKLELKSLINQTIEEEAIFSLGSSPTHRNRENFQDSQLNNNELKNDQLVKNFQNPKLLNYVQSTNNINLEDSQVIISPLIDEEVIGRNQFISMSSNHVQSSLIEDQSRLKLIDYSHNFDSMNDKTTLQGYTDQGGYQNFGSKQGVSTFSNFSYNNQKTAIQNYMQTNNNMRQETRNTPSQLMYNHTDTNQKMKSSFSSADKTASKLQQQQRQSMLNEKNQEILKNMLTSQTSHSIFTNAFTTKMNSRSRSQNGFNNLKRNGMAATFDIILAEEQKQKSILGPNNLLSLVERSATPQNQQQQTKFARVSIKQVKNRKQIQKDQHFQHLESLGNSLGSHSMKQCCENNSRQNDQLNYCCSTQMQRSVEILYSSELRRMQDMNVVIKLLDFHQGQFLITDLFNKNLSTSLQRDLINNLAQQFTSNLHLYESLYLIPIYWWREWCKYVNFTDNYFTFDNQVGYQTGISHQTKIPIKNFNDLVKGKRPEIIKNSKLLNADKSEISDDNYIMVSIDIWTFLSSWYEADYKIKVCLEQNLYNGNSYKKQQSGSKNIAFNKSSSSVQFSCDNVDLQQKFQYSNFNHPPLKSNFEIKEPSNSQQLLNSTTPTQYQKQMTINTQMHHSEKTVFQVNPDEALSTPTYQQYNQQQQSHIFNQTPQMPVAQEIQNIEILMKRSFSNKQGLNIDDTKSMLSLNSVRQNTYTDRNNPKVTEKRNS